MYTSFDNVDLSVANGLEAVRHLGPSTIGIDTIYKSHGKIPDVFLRGCGVPETFIPHISPMHSLVLSARSSSTPASSATRPTTRSLPSGSMPTCRPKACAAGLRRRT